MEGSAGHVQRGVRRRHLRAARDEQIAIAAGAVADEDAARRDHELVGRDGERAGDEDLAAPRVDDRKCALRSGGERSEGGDAGDGQVEREREPARHGEADPGAGEAAGAGADDDPVQVRGHDTGRRQEGVDVGEERLRPGRALPEGHAVGHERTRREVSCGVEREDQHAQDLLAAFCRRCRPKSAARRG